MYYDGACSTPFFFLEYGFGDELKIAAVSSVGISVV